MGTKVKGKEEEKEKEREKEEMKGAGGERGGRTSVGEGTFAW